MLGYNGDTQERCKVSLGMKPLGTPTLHKLVGDLVARNFKGKSSKPFGKSGVIEAIGSEFQE